MIATVQQIKPNVYKHIMDLNIYLPNASFFEIRDTYSLDLINSYTDQIEESIKKGTVLNIDGCKRIGIISSSNKKYKRQL